jgi:hypothetical protein
VKGTQAKTYLLPGSLEEIIPDKLPSNDPVGVNGAFEIIHLLHVVSK